MRIGDLGERGEDAWSDDILVYAKECEEADCNRNKRSHLVSRVMSVLHLESRPADETRNDALASRIDDREI